MRRRRILRAILISAALAFVAVTAVGAYLLRPPVLKRHIERTLTEHLKLDVTIASLSLSILPRLQASGEGLVLRQPNHPDRPPFISIDKFSVDVGLFSVLRRHVHKVEAIGLKIAVPPSERPQIGAPAPDTSSEMTKIIIDEFVARDAELTFVRRDPKKHPLIFTIHDIKVRDLGFARSMPYEAHLINPVPRGLLQAEGTIGPWNPDDPTATPLAGRYIFTDADLGTINGIGGTLQSRGTFSGRLTSIRASGTSEIPNFSLDLGGKPVSLTTKFETIVDGTDGTTTLEHVEAKLFNTTMVVTGAITNLEGPGRHDVALHVQVTDGRIEDLLALAIESATPLLVGDVDLEAALALPPGKGRVRDRLRATGRFGLDQAKFTDADVHSKLVTLSRRSQGKDQDEVMGRVMTSLNGHFTIDRGSLTLPDLAFQVPGAGVSLAGAYGLAGGSLDFRGTLRMEATLSKVVGGFKSLFIKPFDGLFRKNGAGLVLPIKITGTREAPKFALEIGKIFKGS